MRALTRAVVLAALASASCALVVGLEDKELAGAADAGSDAAAPHPDGASGDDAGGPPGSGEIVASSQADPYGIVADDAFVFWANEGGGTIARRVKTLAADVEIVASDQLEPHQMLIDGTHVYWNNENDPPALDGGQEVVVPLLARTSRSAPGTVEIVSADHGVSKQRRMALWVGPVDGGFDDTLYVAFADVVRRYTRDRRDDRRDISDDPSSRLPVAVAVDDTYAYWFDQQTQQAWRRRKDFDQVGNPPPEAIGAPLPSNVTIVDMAVDDRELFFATQGGVVYRLDASPGAAQAAVLAQSEPGHAAIAVAQHMLFVSRWTVARDGQILGVPTKGGAFAVVADGLDRPRDVFVDVGPGGDATVYWTNGDGTIRRAPAR